MYQYLATSRLCCYSVTFMSDSLWSPWTAACQASLTFTVSQSLFILMSIDWVMPPSHLILILCWPLLLPSIFPSIRVFSSKSANHIRWPKYWSFIISPSNEYSVLISFRIDWFNVLAVQGLKSLSSTTVWKHQFFGAQPSLRSNTQALEWPKHQQYFLA